MNLIINFTPTGMIPTKEMAPLRSYDCPGDCGRRT